MSDIEEKQHMLDIVLAQMQDRPQQRRSEERLRRALEVAQRLLCEGGPEACSIPEVAKASDVPRAAIYRYFPDRPALLAAMSSASMEQLGQSICAVLENAPDLPADQLVRTAIGATVQFYNAEPAAAALLFNGPFSRSDRASHHRKSRLLVETLRAGLSAEHSQETLALTLEIVFACLRYGYFRDGHVTAEIEAEANRAALAFLASGDGQ